jgi:quercetin dioxygenase-like cupin family protein
VYCIKDKLKQIDFGHNIKLTVLGEGTKMNALHWRTPKGTISPTHDHPEEQFGYIIEGGFEITIGEEKAVLGPDDCYFIPSNVPHQFRMLEDTIAIDVFSPRRPVPKP